jgi:hypothetical protein
MLGWHFSPRPDIVGLAQSAHASVGVETMQQGLS